MSQFESDPEVDIDQLIDGPGPYLLVVYTETDKALYRRGATRGEELRPECKEYARWMAVTLGP